MDDIKKYIKDMRVEDIVSNVFSAGMEFMARNRELTNEDAQKYKKVVVKEIKRRIKFNKL